MKRDHADGPDGTAPDGGDYQLGRDLNEAANSIESLLQNSERDALPDEATIKSMSYDQREKFVGRIKAMPICLHCGDYQPAGTWCHCTNDE